MLAHGQAKAAAQGPEEAVDRGGGGDSEDGVAAVVEVLSEAAQGDALADAGGAGDEGEATDVDPHLQARAQVALAGGIVHVRGGHVLREGDFREAEVSPEALLVCLGCTIHEAPPVVDLPSSCR